MRNWNVIVEERRTAYENAVASNSREITRLYKKWVKARTEAVRANKKK